MNYCIYCGTRISANDKFCPQCGKSVYGHPANTTQELETDKESNSQLDPDPAPVEQPVQSEERVAENTATQECKPDGDNSTKQKIKTSTLAIVLCSIALLLVIAFVVFKVVQNSRPKYRVVNMTQTTQSTQTSSVEKKDDKSKTSDSAKNKNAVSTSGQLVYSVATDGFVKIRELPNADSDVVGVLVTNRDGAKMISDQGAWWKVRIDSVVGYVNSQYVKLSNTPVKISGLPKVYYVVLKSLSTLDSAQIYNYNLPDGMEGWIYKCTSNGKTVYRVCDGCFSTLQKAQAAINERRSLDMWWSADAWIWKNEGLGDCVFCPPIYEGDGGDFPPLTPE